MDQMARDRALSDFASDPLGADPMGRLRGIDSARVRSDLSDAGTMASGGLAAIEAGVSVASSASFMYGAAKGAGGLGKAVAGGLGGGRPKPVGIPPSPRPQPPASRCPTTPQSAEALLRQLTSEEQLSNAIQGIGSKPSIGAGTPKTLLDAPRLAREYGGNPSDWAKMGGGSSSNHGATMPNGKNFEIHWYENVMTGQRVEYKTKITGH